MGQSQDVSNIKAGVSKLLTNASGGTVNGMQGVANALKSPGDAVVGAIRDAGAGMSTMASAAQKAISQAGQGHMGDWADKSHPTK